MKKSKNTTTEVVTVEVVNNETKKLGRPVNAASARQKRLAELEAKRAAGECKRGRPTVAGSARQERLAKRAEKVANGGELKRGRPVNPNSARQARLNAAAAETEKIIIK